MEVVIELPADLNKLCRTCMAVAGGNKNFGNLIYSEKISNLIADLMSFEMCPNDGLPQAICDECCNQIRLFHSFKQRCEKVDRTLKTLVEQCEPASVKLKDYEESCFYCQVCNEVFSTYYDLARHNVDHNVNKTLLERYAAERQVETMHVMKVENINPDMLLLVDNRKNCEISCDSSYQKFSCKKCSKAFTSASMKNRHCCRKPANDKSEGNSKLPCDICDRTFPDEVKLSLHFVNHALIVESNTDPKIFIQNIFCDVCGETFETSESLGEHTRDVHEKLPLKCSKCCSFHESDLELLKHDKFVNHSMDLFLKVKFSCPICHADFPSHDLLAEHSVQHALKKIRCRVCIKFFATEASFNAHLSCHPKYKFTCAKCGKLLGSKATLKTHMIGVHSELSPFICPTCGKGFKTSNRLHNHKQTHAARKQFICSYCGYSTNNGGDLTTHVRIHTSERPYKCDYVNCGKFFKTSSQRSEHIRRHLQIKTFECSICPMVFGKHSTLKIHQMQHTGEKPFACDICKVNFRRKHHLKFHMKKHDPNRMD